MKNTHQNELRTAALWYAEHGFPVFPLRPREKAPMTSHGFKNASTDSAQIDCWWQTHPDANIGIPAGAPSRLLLLDLDYRNGSVVSKRSDVIRLFGDLPDTAEVVTGSGGRHVYFRFDGGKVPKQIAKGVELKGDGGYSVAPPSVHPNGREYVFDGADGAKALLRVAEPPRWLLDAIANGGTTSKRGTGRDDKWPEGERNNQLTSFAGSLRGIGLGVDAITMALREENLRRCAPPLPDEEVRKIAASICSYPVNGGIVPHRLLIDLLGAPPTLDLLNSVDLFQGRIRFTRLWRSGSIIRAEFANGREAQWKTAKDLRVFANSQDTLLDSTGFLIPTPRSRQRTINQVWEPVAQLIRSLADQDATNVEPAAKDEFNQVIRATWARAGRPHANDRATFFEILRECEIYRRDHAAEKPPRCCVWIGGDGAHSCWVYQDALMSWLSTPVAKSKHYDWDYVRTGLFLLGFKPRELHRSLNGVGVHVRVWQGPLDLLIDDETAPESEL